MLIDEKIFQDEVIRATDLSRGSGEVLNKASKGPVTVIRNEESFALLRREVATHWRREASYAVHLTEIIWHALAHPVGMSPDFEWISGFDDKERQQLADELTQAYRKANRDGSWEDLEAALHEWSKAAGRR